MSDWRTKSNKELLEEAKTWAVITGPELDASMDLLEVALRHRREPQWDAFLNGVFSG